MIKKFLLLLALIGITFFINFPVLMTQVLQCGLRTYPCASESYGNPEIMTTRPNFFVPTSCGGFSGTDCTPAHFSLGMVIADVIFAFIFLVIILGILSVVRKVKNKTINKSSGTIETLR